MSNQEQEPQPEHLNTLDVLQAIVDAWRRVGARRLLTYHEHKEREEALEKALEMGRRHLEMEGRL